METPKTKLTLVHTSDVHLGSERSQEALQGFEAVLSVVRRLKANALLIVGDLFDSSHVSREVVSYAFQSIEGLECPVVMLPGNHDFFITGLDDSLPLPANLFLLREAPGQALTFHRLGLTVWGRPVIDHAPDFRPLQGLPSRSGGEWLVALCHGLAADDNFLEGRSSPITFRELAQADCDYIALGHVHAFREVTQGLTPAFYCGSPSESISPSAAHVTMDPQSGVTVCPIPITKG